MLLVFVCPQFAKERFGVPLLLMSSPIFMVFMGFQCGTFGTVSGCEQTSFSSRVISSKLFTYEKSSADEFLEKTTNKGKHQSSV